MSAPRSDNVVLKATPRSMRSSTSSPSTTTVQVCGAQGKAHCSAITRRGSRPWLCQGLAQRIAHAFGERGQHVTALALGGQGEMQAVQRLGQLFFDGIGRGLARRAQVADRQLHAQQADQRRIEQQHAVTAAERGGEVRVAALARRAVVAPPTQRGRLGRAQRGQ
jgi:hypothetical protein